MYGWVVSDISVWKSMKRLGIKGYVRQQKNPEILGLEHNRYANILNREFHAEKPMQKIVTDVTYIKHKGKWHYLACYLDLFNNEIIDYELSDTFDNFLVMKPAKRILEKAKSTESQILLHSDQGVQYSSAGYCNLLKSYNVIQSMSRAGTPTDNPIIESLNGGIKEEMKIDFTLKSVESIPLFIESYVHYFNNERLSYKLNYKTPVQYRIEQGFA